MQHRLTGLIAAVYTPFGDEGSLNLAAAQAVVDRLAGQGVRGIYICGSTGEGMSLTGAERREVAAAYVAAARGRLTTIVQVGHTSLREAAELAAQAHKIGADAVSATAPFYYKPTSVENLVDCMAQVASGAPDLPFYYYHIPVLTGVDLPMVDFLRQGAAKIPNLAGLKYTAPAIHEYQACLDLAAGHFDALWGLDEMLLAACAVGCQAAVGSTYNIAAPLYVKLLDAFAAGDLQTARALQSQSVSLIRHIARFPFHPAMKQVMRWIGLDCGGCRLPLPQLSEAQVAELRQGLETLGFFQWQAEGPGLD